MLRAYERAGLYPEVAALVFSQHGGTIPECGSIQVTAGGVIFPMLTPIPWPEEADGDGSSLWLIRADGISAYWRDGRSRHAEVHWRR